MYNSISRDNTFLVLEICKQFYTFYDYREPTAYACFRPWSLLTGSCCNVLYLKFKKSIFCFKLQWRKNNLKISYLFFIYEFYICINRMIKTIFFTNSNFLSEYIVRDISGFQRYRDYWFWLSKITPPSPVSLPNTFPLLIGRNTSNCMI